jgi:hypothetical protein
VLTVYLDQMKWIDLARAETGHALGADFVEPLKVLKRAAADGQARFPLSAAHYFETGKQQNARRRIALTATMTRLAGTLRMAPPHVIVPWEIRQALIKVFDLPDIVPELKLFGPGVAHALASPTLRYTAPDEYEGLQLPDSVRRDLQNSVEPQYEEMILSSTTPEGMPDEMRLVLGDIKSLTDDRFVNGQNDVATAIKKLGRNRLVDVMLGTAVADIIDPLIEAAEELGVSLDDDFFVADRMASFIKQMPSRSVEMFLRTKRQGNPQEAWEGNDLNDVTALAVAVPYCDVVVTERSWSAMLNVAKVPQQFGTLVTRRLEDVIDLLEAPR